MTVPTRKIKVLILCTANSARSQMAEGLLRHIAGDKAQVYSAGAAPSQVNAYAIAAMRQRGIDISSHSSDHVSAYLETEFDYVITVCDNAAEACPVFPGSATRIHWSFPDPAAASGDRDAVLRSFVETREVLERRLRKWLAELGYSASAGQAQ